MKKSHLLLSSVLLVVIVLISSGCGSKYSDREAPQAIKGVLDLRDWDFEKDGPVRLDGEWKLFREALLDTFSTEQAAYTHVPGAWNEPGEASLGYGTYQLQILLPQHATGVGLRVNDFSTAYEMDINGRLVCSAGRVGKTAEESVPEYRPALVWVGDSSAVLNVVTRVSNFHHFKGGMLLPVIIGDYASLAHGNATVSRFSGFLYGLFVIIGCFHLTIWFFRRKEKYNLYYGIYCLFNALTFAFTSERFMYTVLGQGMWPVAYKIFLVSAPIFLVSFVLFYDEFFNHIIKRWIKWTIVGLGLLFVLFIIVTPVYITSFGEPMTALYLMLLIVVGIIVNIVSVYRKLPGAIPLFLCNLFFIIAFAYDGAFLEKQMGDLTFSHFASVVYVIVISMVLSRRFAATFGKVDTLTVDLVEANKKLEEQNRNLEKEVEQRTQQMVLAEKMSALGQLTANIAHEINTPLGAIKASANTVQESFAQSIDLACEPIPPLDEESRVLLFNIIRDALNEGQELSPKEERQQKKKILEELEREGISNASLLADYFVRAGLFELKENYLLLLRKIGSGNSMRLLTEQLEQVINNRNIRAAVEKVSKITYALKAYTHFNPGGQKSESDIEADIDTVLTLYHSWFKRGIEVQTDYSHIPPLRCHPDQLNQVWTNVIMNAMQAMGNSGILKITTRKENENAVVRISDTGAGIPEEITDKIFDPFFTTKPHGEGSGLGLDIVKTILKKHDGTISVESKPGCTVFTISIPYNNK